MAPPVPTIEPDRFVVGETVQWLKSLANYPASEGVLSYAFVSTSRAFGESTSVASGDNHLVTITAGDSAVFTDDTYRWQAKYTATVGGAVTIVAEGSTLVAPAFAADTAQDARSTVKITLDALRATIQGKASGDQASMSIAGRSIARYSPEELITWLNKYEKWYADELTAEGLANGKANPSKIRIRFAN